MEADPASTPPEMRYVAIPRGTRIRFYCAVDQPPAAAAPAAGVRERIQAPWRPLDSSHVTGNLTLSHARGLGKQGLAGSPEFSGHTVIVPGCDGAPDPVRLCTGTPGTCPTDPQHVANGAVHGCDGVLATLHGDLHWLACNDVLSIAPAHDS
ncbi:hypothetical protein ABT278_37280 [Streptomyces sp. NPDC001228]|uniref:hypothetical protein n=1 Tax=Streptomyces sp. NPDC001228 TaxID=3154381 RepID=UPI00332622DB